MVIEIFILEKHTENPTHSQSMPKIILSRIIKWRLPIFLSVLCGGAWWEPAIWSFLGRRTLLSLGLYAFLSFELCTSKCCERAKPCWFSVMSTEFWLETGHYIQSMQSRNSPWITVVVVDSSNPVNAPCLDKAPP